MWRNSSIKWTISLGQEKQRFYGTYSLPLGGSLVCSFSLFWCFVLSLILWCKASVSHLLDNYWSLNCCCCTSHWQPWQKTHPCFEHQSNTRALSFFYYDLCLFLALMISVTVPVIAILGCCPGNMDDNMSVFLPTWSHGIYVPGCTY